MSWPVGFAEGCRLLRPDAIFHIVAAVNERIAWLNEVRGSEVITPLPTPERFLSREAYRDLCYQIVYRLTSIANNFCETVETEDWTVIAAAGESSMNSKYGSLGIYRDRFGPKFNAEWLYRAYNWLNALLYPAFSIDFDQYTTSCKQARVETINESGRPRKTVYTKAGSTAPVLGGDWEGYAVSDKTMAASYTEEAEIISPGWSESHISGYYVQGWYTDYSLSTDSLGNYRFKTRVSHMRPKAAGNYLPGTLDCRIYWSQFEKWTRKRYQGIVVTYYPERGTYTYATLTGDTGEPFEIPLYDDPDYTEIPLDEAWADGTKYLSCAQLVRWRTVIEIKSITLPKPPYSYMLEEI